MPTRIARSIIPAIAVLIILGVPIWDKLSPMDGADKAISQSYGSQFRWCVGFSFSSNSEGSVYTRVYLLIPETLSTASLFAVTQDYDKSLTCNEVRFAAIMLLFVYVGLGTAIWRTRAMTLATRASSSEAGKDHFITRAP